MATAKKVTPKKSTAIVPWEQAMAAAANKQAAANKPVGGFKAISIRGGILSVDQNPIKGNTMRCVILVDCPENQFYTDGFDPDTPQSPSCYAFGDPAADDPTADMAPHAECKDPQSKECEGCPNNEWGSAEKGRGKACKNVRRLVIATEDALESVEAMEEAELRSLKVPVMSVKNWAKYVNMLKDDMSRPSWGVITNLSVVPDAKSQFKIQFEFEEMITFKQDLYDALQKRIQEGVKTITAPYPDFEDAPAKKAPAKKVAGKRKY